MRTASHGWLLAACVISLRQFGPIERVSAAPEIDGGGRMLSPARQLTAVDGPAVTPHLVGAPDTSEPADSGLPTNAEMSLKRRIQRALLAQDTLSYLAGHVTVSVHGHEVTLYGEVETDDEKQKVERVVSRVRDVQRVLNRLIVINRAPPAQDLSGRSRVEKVLVGPSGRQPGTDAHSKGRPATKRSVMGTVIVDHLDGAHSHKAAP